MNAYRGVSAFETGITELVKRVPRGVCAKEYGGTRSSKESWITERRLERGEQGLLRGMIITKWKRAVGVRVCANKF